MLEKQRAENGRKEVTYKLSVQPHIVAVQLQQTHLRKEVPWELLTKSGYPSCGHFVCPKNPNAIPLGPQIVSHISSKPP